MAQTPTEAAQQLIDTMTAALTDPTVTDDEVEAAAYNAHDVIQARGGDTQAAFRDTHA